MLRLEGNPYIGMLFNLNTTRYKPFHRLNYLLSCPLEFSVKHGIGLSKSHESIVYLSLHHMRSKKILADQKYLLSFKSYGMSSVQDR